MGPQKIILFGGTFDPPHNGHMTLLAGAIEAVRPDLVLVEPAGTPPHKRAGGTSAAHRLAMCECFRPLFPELVLDTTEIARGGKSYTIDTVRQMNARYPGAQLYFPMGSDMLLSFDGWHRWEDILRLAHLVVTSRNIGDDPALHAKARQLDASGARILFAPVEALPMASSVLRTRLAAGEECENELPVSVRRVIRREGLYTKGDEVTNESETGKRACAQPAE